MSTNVPERPPPSGSDVRHGWGQAGIAALGGDIAAIVLVDVLRFTTAVDVATSAGAAVHPSPWPAPPGARRGWTVIEGEQVEVADGTGPRRLSLSPPSLGGLGPADRIVLPSPNGSACALAAVAAAPGVRVVAACLRNAAAVAEWLRASGGGPVAVIACGELRPDGGLRPAVEDQIGAGAVIAALPGAHAPQARAAAAVYRHAAGGLESVLVASVSGRELRRRGRAEDVVWASAANVSGCVPVMGDDGAFHRA